MAASDLGAPWNQHLKSGIFSVEKDQDYLSRVSVRTWTPIMCLMVAFSRGEFTVHAITLTFSQGYEFH